MCKVSKPELLEEYVNTIVDSMDLDDLCSYVSSSMYEAYMKLDIDAIKEELLDLAYFDLYEKYFGPLPEEYIDE